MTEDKPREPRVYTPEEVDEAEQSYSPWPLAPVAHCLIATIRDAREEVVRRNKVIDAQIQMLIDKGMSVEMQHSYISAFYHDPSPTIEEGSHG